MFFMSMVLLVMGFDALLKETNEKAFFYFLPGLLTILLVSLTVLGLSSVHGDGMRLLGAITLLGWGALFVLMIMKMRTELKIGTYLWSTACVLLSINGLLS